MTLPSLGILFSESLGFDITFKGPAPEFDDIFFGIVRRSAAMITFKDVGVDPVPNYTQGVKKGIAAGTPTFMSLIRTDCQQSSRRAMSNFSNRQGYE